MNLADLVFMVTALLIVAAALGVVMLNNIVHSALALVLSFLGVAAIYFQLQAGFIALVQIMVYAGAISVLIIFAVMLVIDGDMASTNLDNKRMLIPGALVAFLTVGAISWSIIKTHWQATSNIVPDDMVGLLASALMRDYVIAFEAAAILLLVAVVGAIILAKGDDEPA